jgi:hypothetical protein
VPLTDDEIRAVAPSVFGEDKHASRSERYTFIPTSDVLTGLRKEGFQPFMVCQTRVREESHREHTKHMIRLRHAGQINDAEASEIILVNSHNGSSSYQMLAGLFRFVCANGLVSGDVLEDVRIPHKGKIVDEVIEGAHMILDGFDLVREVRDDFKRINLDDGEKEAFGRAALALRYDPPEGKPAPITERDVIRPRRAADADSSLWATFNAAQENLIRGGIPGRNARGQRARTRAVNGIDNNVKLNRALWLLADEMRRLKA